MCHFSTLHGRQESKTIHPTPWKPVLMTTRNWNCILWSWAPSIMALGGRQDGPLRSKVVHRWIPAMKHIGDSWDRFVYVGWVESQGVADDELTWMYDDLWWFVLMILDVGEFFDVHLCWKNFVGMTFLFCLLRMFGHVPFATLKSIRVSNIIGQSSKIEDLSGSDFGELV